MVENTNQVNEIERAMHLTALDIRTLALTTLLMKKGIVTKNEVQASYKKTVEAVSKTIDNTVDEAFDLYMKQYFNL